MSRRRKPPSKRRGQQAPKPGVELDQFYYQELQVWQRRARDLERYSIELHFYLQGLRALHHDETRSALASSKPIGLTNQEWVRIVDYRFSDQPLSAAGSLIQGGRFNIGNDLDRQTYPAFPALYLANSYDTAYAEKFLKSRSGKQGLRGHELALRKPQSFTCVNVTGSIHCLYDLRSASNMKPLVQIISKFSMRKDLKELADSLNLPRPYLVTTCKGLFDTILANDWRLNPMQHGVPANSQILGRLLVESGFEGVVYRSSRHAGICTAVFPENFSESNSYVELADDPPQNIHVPRLDSETWQTVVASSSR